MTTPRDKYEVVNWHNQSGLACRGYKGKLTISSERPPRYTPYGYPAIVLQDMEGLEVDCIIITPPERVKDMVLVDFVQYPTHTPGLDACRNHRVEVDKKFVTYTLKDTENAKETD